MEVQDQVVARIKLSRPMEVRNTAGEVILSTAELTLREPNAGDMAEALDAAGGDATKIGTVMRVLGARCAGITQREFDEIAISDAKEIFAALGGFLGDGPEIGPMLSASSSTPSA